VVELAQPFLAHMQWLALLRGVDNEQVTGSYAKRQPVSDVPSVDPHLELAVTRSLS
jgi:hypothetical protein